MIRTAIFGCGNLGRGTLRAILRSEDEKAVGVFTRRERAEVISEGNVPVYSANDILSFENLIDVLYVCGGSADDLPTLTPFLAEHFNVVDSFDRHSEIGAHLENTKKAATKGRKLALVSAGWDPGIFSVVRLAAKAVFPNGSAATFWGEGISQGHSEAVRRIKGVKDAIQVTIPIKEAVEAAKNGRIIRSDNSLTHKRHCYVAAEEGADRGRIEREIKTMPDYFACYDTQVDFVSEGELYARFPSMYHGGLVTASSNENRSEAKMCFELSMKSNPDFTGAVLAAYGRAVFAAAKRGRTGALTVCDIPLADMLPPSIDKLSFL